jgi:hypothetical protein
MNKVGIWNMAIGRLGCSEFVGDPDTEQSNEARTCRVFYDHVRDRVLEEMPWNFAKRYADLQDIGTPPSQWLYRYRYPNDCLFVLAVYPRGTEPATETYFDATMLKWLNRDLFEIIEDQASGGRAICSNLPDAAIAYTTRITNTLLYPAHFSDALGWALAVEIASPLSAAPNMAQNAGIQYNGILLKAAARNMNEGKETNFNDKDSEFITSRY